MQARRATVTATATATSLPQHYHVTETTVSMQVNASKTVDKLRPQLLVCVGGFAVMRLIQVSHAMSLTHHDMPRHSHAITCHVTHTP